MNVDELLSFTPQTPDFSSLRRKILDVPDQSKPTEEVKRKRSRFEPRQTELTDRTSHVNGSDTGVKKAPQSWLSEEEKEKILNQLDDDELNETVDEATLKKLILHFEKRCYKNQEMRVKYPDQPEKFLDAEVELHEVIQQMHIIATLPEYYHIIVELNSVQTLLQLLNHENTDISIAVVDLLQELTDADLNEIDDDNPLIDALVDGQIVALLIQNVERLDESVKEESDGVHNTLSVVENLLELRPDITLDICKQGLLSWLMKRMRSKHLPFDNNKLYCSEVLAILLQNNDEVRRLLGETDGIDILLQLLSAYKRHDPQSNEEIEYMENLFDALCSCLILTENRERFLIGEGLQLMNLMLRERRTSRNSAIKVLNHAMSGDDGKDNCDKFVEILGLRTIFPLFMKTPKTNKKYEPSTDEMEEHIVSVIASLLRHCTDQLRQRLLSKFTENDHEKVDRLMELHFKYLSKINRVDTNIEKEKAVLKKRGAYTDVMEDSFYMRRLDAGLFTLQLIDYIMLETYCSSFSSSIKKRVMQILNLRGGSIKSVRTIMREYAGNLGEESDDNETTSNHDDQKGKSNKKLGSDSEGSAIGEEKRRGGNPSALANRILELLGKF